MASLNREGSDSNIKSETMHAIESLLTERHYLRLCMNCWKALRALSKVGTEQGWICPGQ